MIDLPEGGLALPAEPGEDPGVEEETDEPIELLVQLAEEGEIDPWDIDIVRVTDKFLSRLDRSDLRTSARALFYASVLLRMKSDVLLSPDEPEQEDPGLEPPPGWEDGLAQDDAAAGDPIATLEGELDRRLERKRVRGSPRTLDELVHELREAERGSWWKETRSYDTSSSPRGFHRGTQRLDYRTDDAGRFDDEPTEHDVTGTTHVEAIEESIQLVREALDAHYEAGRLEVLFDEIAGVGGSRVETFLAVLFLAHRGAVRLEQDELFGDLWIRRP